MATASSAGDLEELAKNGKTHFSNGTIGQNHNGNPLGIVCSARHVDEQLICLRDRCWALSWHHSGTMLATCGEDKTIKFWKCNESEDIDIDRAATGQNQEFKVQLEQLCVIRGDQTRSIRSVAFSPCGRFLASASFDATLIIYERQGAQFEELHRLEGHENEVKCCAYSASGQFLASCSRDKSVWVWQVNDEGNDFEVGSILQQHTADVKFVVWHPREDILVSGGYDSSIRFYNYDGEDWTTAQSIADAHEETIWSGAFEPDRGDLLATVGQDTTINIWRRSSTTAETGQNGLRWHAWEKYVSHHLLGSRWPLYSVAWSGPTELYGGLLAVGGGDATIRLFTLDLELAVLTQLTSLRMHSEVNSIRWRPSSLSKHSLVEDEQLHRDEEMLLFQPHYRHSLTHPQLAVALDDGWIHLLQFSLSN